MKKIVALIVAFSIGILTSGCSLLGEPIAEKVGEAIDRYCEEPLGARDLYRATINAELAAEGHSIVVTCAGDLDPVTLYEAGLGDVLVADIEAFCQATPGRVLLRDDRAVLHCRGAPPEPG